MPAARPLIMLGVLILGVLIGGGIMYGVMSGPSAPSKTTVTSTVTNGQVQTQTLSQTVTSYVITTRTVVTSLPPASTVPGSRANISVPYSNFYPGTAGSTAVNGYVKVVNTGSENAAVDGIYLTYGGQTCNLVVFGVLPQAIVAGDPATTFTAASQTGAGACNLGTSDQEPYGGVVYISNGQTVIFSGTFL